MKLADMTKEELFAELDERYVRPKDCDKRHEQLDEKVEKCNISDAKMNTKMNIILAIASLIAGAVMPRAVETLWEAAFR